MGVLSASSKCLATEGEAASHVCRAVLISLWIEDCGGKEIDVYLFVHKNMAKLHSIF